MQTMCELLKPMSNARPRPVHHPRAGALCKGHPAVTQGHSPVPQAFHTPGCSSGTLSWRFSRGRAPTDSHAWPCGWFWHLGRDEGQSKVKAGLCEQAKSPQVWPPPAAHLRVNGSCPFYFLHCHPALPSRSSRGCTGFLPLFCPHNNLAEASLISDSFFNFSEGGSLPVF